MAKTFNEEDGLTYTEFFAWNKTTCKNLDNLRDSERRYCLEPMLDNK